MSKQTYYGFTIDELTKIIGKCFSTVWRKVNGIRPFSELEMRAIDKKLKQKQRGKK